MTRLRIPGQADHLFRGKPTTCSGASRPPIPKQADHLASVVGMVVGLDRIGLGGRSSSRPAIVASKGGDDGSEEKTVEEDA